MSKFTNPFKHPTIHVLGISSILSYGLLFYSFALLKTPLAEYAHTSEQAIMNALSIAFVIKGLTSPWIGKLVDRYGASRVLSTGLVLGGVGIAGLTAVASEIWIWVCFLPLSFGYSMATYEVAFGAAVQYDESNSRRNISIITFYGGIASTLTWIGLGALLPAVGLEYATLICGGLLISQGLIVHLTTASNQLTNDTKENFRPFKWHAMKYNERRAIIILAAVGSLHELIFGATSLLFIAWFLEQGFGAELAVMLAALYGPFQVIGRIAEMKFGSHIDARITGIIALVFVPLGLLLILPNQIELAVLGMVIFGIGNGVITVSNGYVVNMYFRAKVYGRAKGIISAPRSLGSAAGPAIGVFLYNTLGSSHFVLMAVIGLIAGVIFALLLRLPAIQGSKLQNV